MVQFDWPTYYDGESESIIVNAHELAEIVDFSYNMSEYQAFRSGRALKNLLSGLSGDKALLAHSMGNVVAAEALRQHSEGSALPLVDTYVAMQGAISAGVYEDDGTGGRDLTNEQWDTDLYRSWPSGWHDPVAPDPGYMAGSESAAGKWVNLYNPQDVATSSGWRYNNSIGKELDIESPLWDFEYREDALGKPGGPKEYVRLDPNGLYPPIELEELISGLIDGSGKPGKHAYEIIAFMAQSNALPIGTKSGRVVRSVWRQRKPKHAWT